MTRKEAVQIFFDDVKKAYIADQKAKNIRASGQSAEMFRDVIDEKISRLFGAAYLHFQKVGRKPGGFPPLEKIIQWLKDKTTFKVDEERGPGLKGLAFVIARKIANRGTDIHQGKRPGLNVEDMVIEARKKLAMNLLNIAKDEFIEKLKIKRA